MKSFQSVTLAALMIVTSHDSVSGIHSPVLIQLNISSYTSSISIC